MSEGDQGGSPSRGDEARDDQDRLVHLHAADAQLERVMQFGEEVKVTSSEEATHYRVVIGAMDASEPLVRKRRAQ